MLQFLSVLPLLGYPSGLAAQNEDGPLIMSSGYNYSSPINLAPGQLVTFFVAGIPRPSNISERVPDRTDLPFLLAGVTVGMAQGRGPIPVPVQEVRTFRTCIAPGSPTCNSPTAGVTVQIPFELDNPADARVFEPALSVGYEGRPFSIDARAVSDSVHILRSFDSVLAATGSKRVGHCASRLANDNEAPSASIGLPCPALVYHSDGSQVLWDNPARSGEELVAHAVGLGRTSPPTLTGKVVTSSSPTASAFGIDFNYRPNALASRPQAKPGDIWEPLAQPLYAGTLEGTIGIYEIRFNVPPVPPGTPGCSDLTQPLLGVPYNRVPVWNRVYSNLTVSVGGRYSFDGVGICVAVDEASPNVSGGSEK
jgi:uncharacterized protein (TIGR03437 family)